MYVGEGVDFDEQARSAGVLGYVGWLALCECEPCVMICVQEDEYDGPGKLID